MATTKGTARKKAPEELIEKAKRVLTNSKFYNIVEKAPVNEDGRINLSWVYNQTHEFVLKESGDLKTAKQYAASNRLLAKLKRDYPTEYKIQIIEAEKAWTWSREKREKAATAEVKPAPEPQDVEIELMGDIIFPNPSRFSDNRVLRIRGFALPYSGLKMAADLLRAITGVQFPCSQDSTSPSLMAKFPANFGVHSVSPPSLTREQRLAYLRDYLIQILEEKFGMKIRMCGNCGHYETDGPGGGCKFAQTDNHHAGRQSVRQICGTCGHYMSGFASQSSGICDMADRKESIKFHGSCFFPTSNWKPREDQVCFSGGWTPKETGEKKK